MTEIEDNPKKERKKYADNIQYINLKKNIELYKNDVFIPDYNNSQINKVYRKESWFDLNLYEETDTIKNPNVNEKFIKKIEKSKICSKNIVLLLNKEQKDILNIWFKCNDLMYNETIKFIKDNYIKLKKEFDENEDIQHYIRLNTDKNKILTKISKIKEIINGKIKEKKEKTKSKNDKKNLKTKKDKIMDLLKNTVVLTENIPDIRKIIFMELEIYNLKKEMDKYIDKISLFLKNKPYKMSYCQFKLNYCNIRTYFLKDIKENIIKNCISGSFNKDIKIKAHILDCSIKIACANYQSAITNFNNGNIKHFRVRYWKEKRPDKVIEVENCYFTKNTLCPTVFGMIKAYYKDGRKKIDFNFGDIKQSCKLHYNKKTEEYTLFVPKNIDILNISDEKPKEIIGIDPGLRTFMTCLSENEVIEVCNVKNTRLDKLIENKIKLENLKGSEKNKKIRIKQKKINKRIKGLVDELHWKTIKFLTDNYKNILIGDLSAKGIVRNDTSVLKKYNKQLAHSLAFSKFRERLNFKCSIKNCNYIIVNEYYTSKTCSICSNVNEDLGSSKIYNCIKCKSTLDRDVNGCRNIIIKCL